MGPAPHLSIHDVMPETLPAVRALIAECQAAGWAPPTLLVVPGREWTPAGIAQLHEWQAAGHPIAGHGWFHQISHYGGLTHRLHAALISRRVAEHLCLDAEGILALMRRCYVWLTVEGLCRPSLYVPPAWALGRLPLHRLSEQPFPQVETLRGILDVSTGRWQARALLGYEARNAFQTRALRLSNAIGRARAASVGLRIGLHPHDLDLPLADDLRADLRRFSPARSAALPGDAPALHSAAQPASPSSVRSPAQPDHQPHDNEQRPGGVIGATQGRG